MLLPSLFQSLFGWRAGFCFVVCFFLNRRSRAQPIQHERQGCCGWNFSFLLHLCSACSKPRSETLAQTWVSKFLCCCSILWTLHWEDGCLSLNGWCFPTARCCAIRNREVVVFTRKWWHCSLWTFWKLISSCTVGIGLLFNGNEAYLFLTDAPLTIELFMCVLGFPFYFLTY